MVSVWGSVLVWDFSVQQLRLHREEMQFKTPPGAAKVLKFMSNDTVGRTNLGLVYVARHKFREAVNVLSEAIRIDPSAAEAYQFLGYAYFRLGEEKRAFEAFQSAVQLQSQNADFRYFLGFVSMSLGKRDSAIEQFKALETLDSVLAQKLIDVIYQGKVVNVDQARRSP
jgi:Tfp pilus assembly protein PilF